MRKHEMMMKSVWLMNKVKGFVFLSLLGLLLWFRFSGLAEDFAVYTMRLSHWAGYPLDDHTIALIAVGGVVSGWIILYVVAHLADLWDRAACSLINRSYDAKARAGIK